MKKAFLFIIIISCAISCFAFSFPPSDNLVYSYHEYGNDKVIITRNKELGSYSWHFGKGWGSSSDYDWFVVNVITGEYNYSKTISELWVYYQPAGYTDLIRDRYFIKNGYLYRIYHDFKIPVEVPENRSDWTAYHKTIEDYYDYWIKDLPAKKEME